MRFTTTRDEIAAVLAGTLRYDDASDAAQAAVRDAWQARLDELANGFDLEAEFIAEGRTSWVSTFDGQPITVYADPR